MRAQKKAVEDESKKKQKEELPEEDYDLLDDEEEDGVSKNDTKATIKSLVSSKGLVVVLAALISGFIIYRSFFGGSKEDAQDSEKKKNDAPFSKIEVQKSGQGQVARKESDENNPFLKAEKENAKNYQNIFEDPDLPPLKLEREDRSMPMNDLRNLPNVIAPDYSKIQKPEWVDLSKNETQYNPSNKSEYYEPKDKMLYSVDDSGKQIAQMIENVTPKSEPSGLVAPSIEPPKVDLLPDQQASGGGDAGDGQGPLPGNIVDSTKLTIEEKRKASMFVLTGSGPNQQRKTPSKKKDFLILDESVISVKRLNESKGDVKRLTNLDVSLLTGKILDAVLETSINTEIPGPVRAVVSYDVYAEIGDKILIPKGSRLYGSYSSEVTRGQSRLKISWTRIVRPDGVDVTISAQASDQFGRTGIQGDVDNRFGDSIANSLLLTLTTLGTGLLAQQLGTGQGQSQIVNPNGTFTTTNITPLNYAAQAAIQTATDMISSLTQGNMKLNPIISLPQGTKIKVVIEQDVRLPPFKKITVN